MTHPSSALSPLDAAAAGVPALRGAAPVRRLDTLIEDRAAALPDATVLIELDVNGAERTRLTFAQLVARGRAIAAALPPPTGRGRSARGVVLSVEGNADFMCGLVGILLARRFAVPVVPPIGSRHTERGRAIVRQTRFGAVLADASAAQAFEKLGLGSSLPPVVRIETIPAGASHSTASAAKPADVALVQYTSGSTRDPRGVVLTHANFLANLTAIQRQMGLGLPAREVLVSWLPPYHDMGLVGSFLNALHLGATLVALPPTAFLRRPLLWLEVVSRYRGTFSGGPNFAYQLCLDAAAGADIAGLDLRSWRIAFNGAEPVLPATCAHFAERFAGAGFSAGALYPCYGLAECVVMATGIEPGAGLQTLAVSQAALRRQRVAPPADDADRKTLVSCGTCVADHRLVVADPATRAPLPDGTVGELLLAGPSVAQRYLDDAAATRATFDQTLPDGTGGFLRTGDLGFLHDGALYVVGRAKDLIIINGENHHPADLEATAGAAAPELRAANCCTFAETDAATGTERLIVVAAVRATIAETRRAEIADAIREAIAAGHALRVAEITLVKPGALPRTTSGKLQRQLCRERLRQGALPVLWRRAFAATDAGGTDDARPARPGLQRLRGILEKISAVGGLAIEADTPLDRLGLDSIDRVRLLIAIEDAYAVRLDARAAAAWKTVGDLLAGVDTSAPAAATAPTTRPTPAAGVPPATRDESAAQAHRWRDDIFPRYATFQEITGLQDDNPLQILRIALAMEAYPDIGRARSVELAREWVRREQLTGWFYHVPRVRDLLADPRDATPAAWRTLRELAATAPAPAIVTLFHTSGWDWLLALLVRAASEAGRPIAVLYDAAIAELNEPLLKRFEVFIGRNTGELRRSGAITLVDIRDPKLEFQLLRHLDENRLVVAMPDAVHGSRTRTGVVELPFLGGAMRVAGGMYRIAAMRGTPLVHVVHAHRPHGPQITVERHASAALASADPAPFAAALAAMLQPFTATLTADPAQWRQWRALVPTPTAPPSARPDGPLFDRERFLVLAVGRRVWILCRQSQRTFALPEDVFAALEQSADERAFRTAVRASAEFPADALEALLLLLKGSDPHAFIA